MAIFPPRVDPEVLAPVGAYMTDEVRLIEILESDHSGAIGECCHTGSLVSLEPDGRGVMVTAAADQAERRAWRMLRMRSEAR